jgi:tetratricopeptide (TPR) repeat protein
MSQYQEAIHIKPDYAEAHYNLGIALFEKGQTARAMNEFQEASRLKPDENNPHNATALNNLAWRFAASSDASLRDGTLAVKLAERACELTNYRKTIFVGTLAAAYAEAGRFDEAVATGQRACALAAELGETNLLKRNQELVILYQAHQPYHEPPPNSDASQLH